MRARPPDREGHVQSHGVRIFWEEHGDGARAVLFMPPWQIVDRRVWKLQVPYFARYFRTLAFDAPGTGHSDRPATGYDHDRIADHARAVLDAAGVERASLVCLSRGTWPGAILAARHAERVERLVLTAVAMDDGRRARPQFFEPRDRYEGWEKFNAHYWRTHYREFIEFFMTQTFTEPHSTKAREDGLAWALGNVSKHASASPVRKLGARPRGDRIRSPTPANSNVESREGSHFARSGITERSR